jgi:hypothetical protein
MSRPYFCVIRKPIFFVLLCFFILIPIGICNFTVVLNRSLTGSAGKVGIVIVLVSFAIAAVCSITLLPTLMCASKSGKAEEPYRCHVCCALESHLDEFVPLSQSHYTVTHTAFEPTIVQPTATVFITPGAPSVQVVPEAPVYLNPELVTLGAGQTFHGYGGTQV